MPDTSVYPESALPGRAGSGWTGRDLVIGTSLLVLLVALFMPWFSGSTTSNVGSGALVSEDGPRAHGYVWFVFALVIISLVVLVAREAISRVPGNLPSPQQLLTIATGLALLLAILAAFIKPSPTFGFDVFSPAGTSTQFTPSVGFSYGGFVAVVAALVAFVAAFGAAGRLNSARLGMPAIRRRTSTSQ